MSPQTASSAGGRPGLGSAAEGTDSAEATKMIMFEIQIARPPMSLKKTSIQKHRAQILIFFITKIIVQH